MGMVHHEMRTSLATVLASLPMLCPQCEPLLVTVSFCPCGYGDRARIAREHLTTENRPLLWRFVPQKQASPIGVRDVQGALPRARIDPVVSRHEAFDRPPVFTTQIVRCEPEGHPGESAKALCRIRSITIILRPTTQERIDARDEVCCRDLRIPAYALDPLFAIAFRCRGNR